MYKYTVYTHCSTYNHAPYIVDAMNGFTKQKTTFPVITAIIDDASSDGEQEIIRSYLTEHFQKPHRTEETEYASIICAHHKTNPNCQFVVLLLKYNHYSIKKDRMAYLSEWLNNAKYFTICEGDDYWTHPQKLQMQVDFMEAHPSHSLCFCAHQTLSPQGHRENVLRYDYDVESCPMKDIILGGGGFMSTNSMLYRRELYIPYQEWAPDCPVGDGPTMLSLAAKGDVGYLHKVMCVYRIATPGSWTSRMHSSHSTRESHHFAVLKMWHQFDLWTNKKYHKLIVKKIIINWKNYIHSEISTLLHFHFQR